MNFTDGLEYFGAIRYFASEFCYGYYNDKKPFSFQRPFATETILSTVLHMGSGFPDGV